ncbi:tol-pal system-associated acyl-CoA thioesterase [Poseidonocella sedimentorum]|uniref:Acyl-CoA thioester hydrolase n=1 Tax=Poseidonocella sedimentorum TaxID=871652 RepID=A0A1I6EG21_9RHOB|nr:tol-pal system-associated acyl-CoA thioesterase [Poseidonocella sedimentorum]SFR16432.1 acyl-CoA thioester hydrolase [Poseidonocella sedimentorum]
MHRFPIRVYYEDTDMAGIVYYANYLRYIERARSDWVRGLGIDQMALRDEEGLVFAVRRIEADYLKSAHFDEELVVETTLARLTPARLVMHQKILRDGEALFEAEVVVVCMSTEGQPARLPANIRQQLQ